MKQMTLPRLLAALALVVALPVSALQAAEACPAFPGEGTAGTVEAVREVPLARDLHAFDHDSLEHSIGPEMAEELVVRLDVGPFVVFTQRQSHGLHAGERVRVTLNGSIARVEPDPGFCSAPLAALPFDRN